MNAKNWAVAAVTMLAGLVGHAETTYVSDGTTLKITVPAGETNAIESAKIGALLDNSVTDVRKLGLGGLIVNVDITAYEGAIHIDEGTWRIVDSKGLGKRAADPAGNNTWDLSKENGVGQVYVANGATLESAPTVKDGVNSNGKIINFGGMGVNGIGALVWNSSVDQSPAFGVNLNMTDDALVHGLGEAAYHITGQNVRLDMGAHTLTFRAESKVYPIVLCEIRTDVDGKAARAGNIVAEGSTALVLRNYEQIVSANQSFAFNDAAHLDEQSVGGSLQRTIVWNSTGTNDWTKPRWTPQYATPHNKWDGNVQLTNGKTMTTRGTIQHTGKVSGSGNLAFVGVLPLANPTNLVALSGEHTFTGGFSAKGVNVTLGEKSVQNLTDFTAEDSNVTFADSAYALPTGTFSADVDVAVTGGTGTWQGFVKKGSGALDYASQIGAETLDVQGGTVALHAYPYDWEKIAGAIEGEGYYSGSSADTKIYNDMKAGVAYRHRLATGLTHIYDSVTGPKSKNQPWFEAAGIDSTGVRYLITYSGYLWNRTDHDVTWTLAGCILVRCGVWIDGKLVLDASNVTPPKYATITLTPGPHAFRAYCSHALGDGGTPSAFPGFYIQYDPEGRDPMASGEFNRGNFIKLENKTGELPLITWTKPGEDVGFLAEDHVYNNEIKGSDGTNWVGVANQQFKSMRFGAGAGIDLAGTTNVLRTLEGWPTVANGSSLTVLEKWTVSTDDLKAGGAINVSELGFGEDVEFVIDVCGKVRGTEWTLATSATDITGSLRIKDESVLEDGTWTLVVEPRSVKLRRRPSGLLLIVE